MMWTASAQMNYNGTEADADQVWAGYEEFMEAPGGPNLTPAEVDSLFDLAAILVDFLGAGDQKLDAAFAHLEEANHAMEFQDWTTAVQAAQNAIADTNAAKPEIGSAATMLGYCWFFYNFYMSS